MQKRLAVHRSGSWAGHFLPLVLATAIILIASLLSSSAFSAEPVRKFALVIGISNYQYVPRLDNPARDADLIAELFTKAGFQVVRNERDLDNSSLRRVVREFSELSKNSDIAVIYFAGHGIEVDGSNYLVPSDARLISDFDIDDETVSLDRLIKALEGAKKLKLVILDACRENPFARTMKRTTASRSVGRGLARVEPAFSDTLVAFAAKAGALAADGVPERNSPFSAALVKHIAEPGLDLRLAFGRVRDDVLKETANRQEPFVYGSLGGQTTSLVPAPAIETDAAAEARRIQFERVMNVIMASALPQMSKASREIRVRDYIKGKDHRAQALEQRGGLTWRSEFSETETEAADRALEGCQMRYDKPCALIAVNDTIVADGQFQSIDVSKMKYAGKFDPQMIPGIRASTRKRNDIQQYDKMMEPKAMAIHPWGRVFLSVGNPTLKEAAETALAKCNNDPDRKGIDGPCLIYSLNNDVVLAKRMLAPDANMDR